MKNVIKKVEREGFTLMEAWHAVTATETEVEEAKAKYVKNDICLHPYFTVEPGYIYDNATCVICGHSFLI